MLNDVARLREIFTDDILVGFKRNENLRDILVHRKHNNIIFKWITKPRNAAGNVPCALTSQKQIVLRITKEILFKLKEI